MQLFRDKITLSNSYEANRQIMLFVYLIYVFPLVSPSFKVIFRNIWW